MSDNKPRQIKCVVVSDKMQKSRVGALTEIVKHPVVGKYIKKTSKLMFHDEHNVSKMGDQVIITSHRPISGRKNFILLEVLTKK